MKTEHMILGAAVGLFLIARMNSVQRVGQLVTVNNGTQGSDWFDDMWARLHGRDLSIDGNNPVQSTLNNYGLSNEMGWNYQWNGGMNTIGRA